MSIFRASLTLAVLSFAVVTVQALAQDASSGSIQDGVYSEDQAKRGGETFLTTCSACHVNDAFGPAFMEGWSGQTLDDMVTFIQDTMPEDNPGGLKRSEYVAVVAYMLKLNGIKAGAAPLKTASPDLRQIKIEGPFSAGS